MEICERKEACMQTLDKKVLGEGIRRIESSERETALAVDRWREQVAINACLVEFLEPGR